MPEKSLGRVEQGAIITAEALNDGKCFAECVYSAHRRNLHRRRVRFTLCLQKEKGSSIAVGCSARGVDGECCGTRIQTAFYPARRFRDLQERELAASGARRSGITEGFTEDVKWFSICGR